MDDEWKVMFREVRETVRLANSWEDGILWAAALARRRPDVFDDPDYWDRVKEHDFGYSFEVVTRWAMKGLEKIEAKTGWETLLLDLGDCPETFDLALYGSPFEERLAPETNNLISSLLFGQDRTELANRHVEELDDEILCWHKAPDDDYFGNNGYFLWLVMGSLALTLPLHNVDLCKSILSGRERLYLLTGFEGIFTYLATVTPAGLVYEYKEQPPEAPYIIKPQLSKNGELLQGILLFEQTNLYGWEPPRAC